MEKNRNQSIPFGAQLKRMMNMVTLIALVALMSGTLSSCNSEKKAAKKDLEARLEVAKQRLTAIINNPTISVSEMEKELSEIKSWNFDSPKVKKLESKVKEVKGLMSQADTKLNKAKQQEIEAVKVRLISLLNNQTMGADDLERELNLIKAMNISDSEVQKLIKQVEDRIKEMRSSGIIIADNADLDKCFNDVIALAKTGNMETTNMKIRDILKFFTAPDAPLLIIVYMEGNKPIDYDKPTTIEAYLSYLKDQKVNHNTTHSMERDNSGKIKLVELLKNKN